MSISSSSKEKIGKSLSTLVIILSVVMLYQWKNYENEVLNKASTIIVEEQIYDDSLTSENSAKIDLLEKMAIAERSKIKVMIEHDNSPLTKTYPMILDATGSFDPDVVDEIQYVWKQIGGQQVDIRPNPFTGKVSFEAEAGEYTFELTISDDYGSEAVVTRTVVIEPEPNTPPVIDMKIRQGSGLN